MMTETYNGWANRETWNVALWLGNDEGFYREAVSFGQRTLPAHDEEAKVEAFCRNLFGDMTPDGDRLDGVDWAEIAADIKEMAGIEEEGKEGE